MGKTEEDWNGLKLVFLKTVQPNSFSKLILAACNFINNAQETYLFVSDLWYLSFRCNFFAYFKFHTDWGRVIGKIEQTELDCHDTAPLIFSIRESQSLPECNLRRRGKLSFFCGIGYNLRCSGWQKANRKNCLNAEVHATRKYDWFFLPDL